MRKNEFMAEVAFGHVGAHDTAVSRMFAVLASDADAAHPADARCPTDARPRSTSVLRQSQVLDSKGH